MNSKMKTITLFFFMVFGMTLSANAQITKGNWMVGGDAFYSSTEYKYASNEENQESSVKFYEIRVNPNIGYFFIDKLAGGLQINLLFNENDSRGNANTTNQSYGLGPFVRYYFLDTEKQLNVFAQASYSLRFGEKFAKDNAIDWSGYGLQAGTVFFFNQSVGLELSLKYTSITQKSNDFKVNNLLVGLGFQIHLDRK